CLQSSTELMRGSGERYDRSLCDSTPRVAGIFRGMLPAGDGSVDAAKTGTGGERQTPTLQVGTEGLNLQEAVVDRFAE
ncbi:hypothetical protein, partial [Stenotrophomonas sp. SrG]|uniref:hypothetical protein n=1 Tax=Stenotrophomonas sp. SrG TaxID=3414430 RepID=UPI003CECD468